MKEQIQEELNASIQYLAMGAHFSRDIINRPGFAKLFFEAASEERQHALKLITYLLMRGNLTTDVSHLIKRNVSWVICCIGTSIIYKALTIFVCLDYPKYCGMG